MKMARTALMILATTSTQVACEQLTATVQAVSVVTRTPDLASASGMPSQLVTVLPLDELAGNGAVGVFTAVGERDNPTSTEPPTEVSNATVTVKWAAKSALLCAGEGAGTYVSSSAGLTGDPCVNATLSYDAGQQYVTEIETPEELHTVSVTAPPAIQPTQVVFTPQFTPAQNFYGVQLLSHAKNTALRVDWSAAGSDRPAFVTLFRINYTGSSSNPTGALDSANWSADANNPVFDNFPKTPGATISLVLASEKPTFADIPADRFPASGLYVLIVTPTEISTDVSNNLALGSAGMAGYGTAFVFWAQ